LQAASRTRYHIPRSPIPHQTHLWWARKWTARRPHIYHCHVNGNPTWVTHCLVSPVPKPTYFHSACWALPHIWARWWAICQSSQGLWCCAKTKNFVLDPSQDLIMLLEHRPAPESSSMAGADICVHLRKLSTVVVSPHPAAKNAMLCQPAIGPVHGCMIQIVKDIVGMYFWMPFHAVLIWNWIISTAFHLCLSM
jgi:hypothetical protein